MASVTNQKIIKIEREPKGKVYSYANIEAEDEAALALKAGAFKLWCYLRRNKNGYMFALSPTDCEERFGIALKQYRNGVAELIEKGYLELDRGNVYVFHEKLKNERE